MDVGHALISPKRVGLPCVTSHKTGACWIPCSSGMCARNSGLRVTWTVVAKTGRSLPADIVRSPAPGQKSETPPRRLPAEGDAVAVQRGPGGQQHVPVAVFAAGAGGFWWGRHTQAVEIASTETGIAAAFRDGPGAAAAWLNFMQANDGNLVRDVCAKSTVKTADGRHACAVGLWVDLPPNPPPRTEPIRR